MSGRVPDGRAADALKASILEQVRQYAALVHGQKPFVAGRSAVPVSGRVFDGGDVSMLVESALEFWLTSGRYNTLFEEKLGKFLGIKRVLTVNSGSSANLLAFASLTSPLLEDRAIKPGDEIITCATGFPTTINPALIYGMVPVFIDAEIPTYNIDARQIEAAITPKTRAIMVAHMLGNPFDLDAVTAIAKKHGLFLIEDCCDALGSTYDGKLVGNFGDIGTLSFYPAHHITMGEGGAVFTNNARYMRAAESLRDWGRDCYCAPGFDNTCKKRFEWQLGTLPQGYDHKYIYSHLGYNLKITDMQAAVGLAQLAHLADFMNARRANFARLFAGLKGLEEFLVLPRATVKSDPCWFGFPICVRENAPFGRDKLVLALNRAAIGTRLMFGGNLVHQPYLMGRQYRKIGDLSNSDRIMRQGFWIGVYPGLSEPHIDFTIDQITQFCRSH